VAEYRDMLLSTGNIDFPSVVTEEGFEAMPAVEYYLASQYAQRGHITEAELLVDSLEQNYPDSLVFWFTGDSKGLDPTPEVIPKLRSWVEGGGDDTDWVEPDDDTEDEEDDDDDDDQEKADHDRYQGGDEQRKP